MTTARLVIATRESRLALWQARHVQHRLGQAFEGLSVELLGMTTRGDQILDRSLSKIGGKGLFVKELEFALEDGRADLAVHSLKDVPMLLPEGFVLGAILERDDPFDALVSIHPDVESLPRGAVVGTSSLRRQAALLRARPDLRIEPLRGNLDTRLAKLDAGGYDAIVLAAAGLRRLGLQSRIRAVLPLELSLPAPGQGALAIEIVEERGDVARLIAALNHAPTSTCVHAERAVARALGGSCEIPLAAYAQVRDGILMLRAAVASPLSFEMIEIEVQGDAADPQQLGQQAATALRERGADRLLADVV
ncbi:hydroxymethylbilane synthase [soil metagenome]